MSFISGILQLQESHCLWCQFLYMTFVGYKLMPDIDNNTFVDGGHTGRKSAKLSPIKEKIAIIIIVVTILAMLFESVIGIPMYIVACIGAVLLVLSGILNEKEALDSIHQPTIFLFAGVLTLSEAIKITGAGDVVADWMISLIGNTTNPYLIMAGYFSLTSIFHLPRSCRIVVHTYRFFIHLLYRPV